MSDELARYQRQMLLPMVGESGQRRLRSSSVLLVGCGALGTVIADALVRAGVGRLRLIDRDIVEQSNLHRQLLFTEADAAEALPKAEAARRALRAINRDVCIECLVADFAPQNAERLADGNQVIVDGTDNFETRLLINDVAVKQSLPYVYGGAVGVTGTWFTVLPPALGGGPCLRCVVREPPAPGSQAGCDTAGVLASAAAVVAHHQVVSVMQLLLGCHADVDRRMHQLDLWTGWNRAVDMAAARDPDCPCCSQRRFDYLDNIGHAGAAVLCGRQAVQITPRTTGQVVDLEALSARLAPHGDVKTNPHTLRAAIMFQDRAIEMTVFTDGRAIVKGTSDPLIARNLYARYIGL